MRVLCMCVHVCTCWLFICLFVYRQPLTWHPSKLYHATLLKLGLKWQWNLILLAFAVACLTVCYCLWAKTFTGVGIVGLYPALLRCRLFSPVFPNIQWLVDCQMCSLIEFLKGVWCLTGVVQILVSICEWYWENLHVSVSADIWPILPSW